MYKPKAGDSFNGYTVIRALNSDSGSEKYIFAGTKDSTGENVCMCFPKDQKAIKSLRREAAILRHMGPHDNIIKLIDLIENWGGKRDPCLVTQLIEPLGYDLFEAFYQQKLAGEMTMPVYQIRQYVQQLCDALDHLHSHGIIHRDLKVDQVLVNTEKGHKVVLIDYGMAHGPREELSSGNFNSRNGYMAPELCGANTIGDSRVDMWGLGIIIYSLISGNMPSSQQLVAASQRGELEKFLKRQIDRGAGGGDQTDAIEACSNLLHHDPAQRWTLEQARAWAEQNPLGRSMSGRPPFVERWSSRSGEIPQVFGLNIPRGWEFAGKTIQELDLFRNTRLQILLIIRNSLKRRTPENIVTCPGAQTQILEGDWLCFGLSNDSGIDVDAQKRGIEKFLRIQTDSGNLAAQLERRAKSQDHKGLYPFLAEFDILPFPNHCYNCFIGPASMSPPGANCLNLRACFHMNLAGLQHEDGTITWFPGVRTCLHKGDKGLFIRVPPPGDGPWQTFMPSITRDTYEKIQQLNLFRKMVKCEAEESWSAWMKTCSSDTPPPAFDMVAVPSMISNQSNGQGLLLPNNSARTIQSSATGGSPAGCAVRERPQGSCAPTCLPERLARSRQRIDCGDGLKCLLL